AWTAFHKRGCGYRFGVGNTAVLDGRDRLGERQSHDLDAMFRVACRFGTRGEEPDRLVGEAGRRVDDAERRDVRGDVTGLFFQLAGGAGCRLFAGDVQDAGGDLQDGCAD